MSLCRRCSLRQLPSTVTHAYGRACRPFSTTLIRRDDSGDELQRVKQRAWYLDPSPSPVSSSQTGPSRPRQPRFTTFDPESTRSETDPDAQTITPLPANAKTSPILVQLHEHLTRQSDSVDPSSVRFLHPPSSKILRDRSELGEGSLMGESGGTGWQWVIVCQVRGRGRGVVNRAEKEVRKWVSLSSLACDCSSAELSTGSRKS